MSRKANPQGTDNVLVDLGFDDAEALSAKAALALKLSKLIAHRGLSQMQAAAILGMPQSKVSQVRRYKLPGHFARTVDAGAGVVGSAG